MVKIRKIEESDANAVTSLSAQLGYETTIPETEERIKATRNNQDNCAFVATIDGKVVGWIHGFFTIRLESPKFVEIAGLVVDVNHRKMNIGKKLIDEVIAWAETYKVEKVKVRCNTLRTGSHKFYEKTGFIEVKEQKIFEMSIEL